MARINNGVSTKWRREIFFVEGLDTDLVQQRDLPVGVEVHAGSARVSAELPESDERFEDLVPPEVAAPCFAIRRPAIATLTLGDYVGAGIMSGAQENRDPI